MTRISPSRLKRALSLVAIVPLVWTLSACYFFEGSVSFYDGDPGEATVRVGLAQGTETDLFASPTDALDFVNERFGGEWTTSNERFTGPWASVMFDQSQSTPATFRDVSGNSIRVTYLSEDEGPDGRPEYVLTFSLDFPTPPEGSDAPTFGGGFAVEAPPGWNGKIRQRGSASTSGFDGSAGGGVLGTVSWLEVTGDSSTIIALQPPYTPPAPEPEPVAEPEAVAPAPSESPAPTTEPSDESSVEREEEVEEAPGAGETADDESATEAEDTATAQEDLVALEGSVGMATTEVSDTPGFVKIGDEVIPAMAVGNAVIAAGSDVRVVGVFSGGLLVESVESSDPAGMAWAIAGSVAGLAVVGTGIFLVIRRNRHSRDASKTHSSHSPDDSDAQQPPSGGN